MKKYTVEIGFPNANADFNLEVTAKSKGNAFWVAQEAKFQHGMGMGQVKSIKEIK